MSPYQLKHPEKDFDLGVFLPITGDSFLVAIQKSCNDSSELSINYFYTIISSIKLLFSELMRDENDLLNEIRGESRSFGNEVSWMQFLTVIRWRLQRRSVSASSKNKYISGINYVLLRLQNSGYIPRFNTLSTFKPEKKVSKSLLEFCFDEQEVFGAEIERDDAAEIDSIVQSLQMEFIDVNLDNIADQCAYILKARLSLIRSEAEAKLSHYIGLRLSGLRAIRKNRHLLPLVDQWLSWRRSKANGLLNPHTDEIKSLSNEQWWGVYLAWCWYRNQGLEPKFGIIPSRTYNMFRTQFLQREDSRADIATAEAIGCCMAFIASASVLLIHDLVANVDSVRKIPVDADYLADHGIVDIEWVKPRSRGFITAMDDRQVLFSPAKVIRVIRLSTRKYRRHTSIRFKEQLFLHHHGAKGYSKSNRNEHVAPMVPSSTSLLTYIKKIINDASGYTWSGTARAIRVSLLLYKGLTGGLVAVQLAAKHKNLQTSMLYANSLPMRLSFDRKMREFREWLQVLVTVEIENVAAKLGIDEAQYQNDKKNIIASQFGGVYCRDPKSGIQLGTTKGKNCGAVSNCMTCSNRKNLFVATEENIIHLLQWNEALKHASKRGLINVLEEDSWGFWCVFIETLLEKLFQSGDRYKSLLHSARQSISSTENPYLRIDFGGLS